MQPSELTHQHWHWREQEQRGKRSREGISLWAQEMSVIGLENREQKKIILSTKYQNKTPPGGQRTETTANTQQM